MIETVEVNSIIHYIALIDEWLDAELANALKTLGRSEITTSYAPAFRVMQAEGGVMPITQLAERMHRSKPYVTHMVNTLEKCGYFQRGKDEDDKRINYVILTELGNEIAREIDMLVQKTTAVRLATFSFEEMEILTLLLTKIVGVIGN